MVAESRKGNNIYNYLDNGGESLHGKVQEMDISYPCFKEI